MIVFTLWLKYVYLFQRSTSRFSIGHVSDSTSRVLLPFMLSCWDRRKVFTTEWCLWMSWYRINPISTLMTGLPSLLSLEMLICNLLLVGLTGEKGRVISCACIERRATLRSQDHQLLLIDLLYPEYSFLHFLSSEELSLTCSQLGPLQRCSVLELFSQDHDCHSWSVSIEMNLGYSSSK